MTTSVHEQSLAAVSLMDPIAVSHNGEDVPTEDHWSRSPTDHAYALHEAVPPDRWCVTRQNLEYLQKEASKVLHPQAPLSVIGHISK